MPDLTVDDLPAAGAVDPADTLIVGQSGAFTRKATVAQLDQTDIANLPPAAPDSTDLLAFADGDDGDAKKSASIADIVNSVAPLAEYGQIYGRPAAAQSVVVDTVWTAIPVSVYQANGLSSANVTPDEATGRITINAAGVYQITWTAVMRRFALITEIDLALFEFGGNVEIPAVSLYDLRFEGEGSSHPTLTGLVTVAAGDVFEVRAKRDLGANTVEIWSAALTCVKVA